MMENGKSFEFWRRRSFSIPRRFGDFSFLGGYFFSPITLFMLFMMLDSCIFSTIILHSFKLPITGIS
jgi:hypothetical protein